VKRGSTETAFRTTGSVVEGLAELFPEAVSIRLPVEVSLSRAGGAGKTEATILEFGTANEALFASTIPFEFGDSLRLTNSDGSLDAAATVIAVHFEHGRRAVAVRFSEKVRNWIIR
jgi:hypothetical protein